MNGKERCRVLKQIRADIAEKNDIPFETSECTHEGECKGTCPKCESEMRYLEKELKKKKKLGKLTVLAGISAAAVVGLSGCESNPVSQVTDVAVRIFDRLQNGREEELAGDVVYYPDDDDLQLMGDVPDYCEDETDDPYYEEELMGEIAEDWETEHETDGE